METNTPENQQVLFTEMLDIEGKPVQVKIDEQSAKLLLEQISQTFDWYIQIGRAPVSALQSEESIAWLMGDWTPQVFIKQVQHAASLVGPGGHFGARQVFINHVWQVWQNTGGRSSLDTFKHRLLECLQNNLLELGCAALIQTLNAVDLAQSETITEDGSIYHFIILSE
ncbi:hypothetical protein [Candidatus Venteria ishoeyi]|uniref:Uncharacterized protein n=1 Tax=Candidatus Venteria ishoeyi TaxID=1899563 RepID=A0A1H6F6Z6_9GAMM|nr:hypothetical protein [Candidatus Venteria ishoeyi]MDM8548177.1 hypothetical protein [Candidatus Venteria ishoeyi]SEH05910.1 Uncharacterised protein [Candidatus Venteria ishoeyi]